MKAQLNQAIASVAARTANGAPVSGSSFLVTDRHLLTAFHVVGDRVATQKGTPTFHNELAVSFAHIGLTDLPARIATDCFDASADWALIELDRPVANIRPIPLATVSSRAIDQIRRLGKSLNFETWGFPAVATLRSKRNHHRRPNTKRKRLLSGSLGLSTVQRQCCWGHRQPIKWAFGSALPDRRLCCWNYSI